MSDDCLYAPDPVFCIQQQEGFKCGVHLGLFGLAMTCLLYNLGAFLGRRETHLAMNIGIYGGLAAWEADQIRRHTQALL